MINVLFLVWFHFIADFMCQTDEMALNKSSSNKWLTFHVATYSLPFLLFGWQFAFVTFITHWITDFLTSRGTAYLWQKGERHWFYVLIGFDQAIHMTTLILTLEYLAI